MADLRTSEQPGEPLVYRPISGIALIGFILALIFAGMVSITAVVALAQGLPVFLPPPALGLAIVAAAVCFLARRRILNAEGTMAGLALARWGLWLSVLLGATYFVYTWVTGLALAKQANDFLMVQADEDSGFFPHLMNAATNRTELYQAFLLSLPVTSRGGSKATNEQAMLAQYDQPGKDGEGGNISKFSRHPLVQLLATKPKIEPLGLADWGYEKKSYYVVRAYRFTTPEMVIDTPIVTHSTEGAAEGEQRKWFVDVTKTPRFVPKPTATGEKLLELRFYSKRYLEQWRGELQNGEKVPEYSEADTDWTKIFPKKDNLREDVKWALAETFSGARGDRLQIVFQTDEQFARSEVRDGRVQILHSARLLIPGSPSFSVELDLTVATQQPVDLSAPLPPRVFWTIRKISVKRAAIVSKGPGSS